MTASSCAHAARAYVTGTRLAALAAQLSARDLAVLDTLACVRVATGRQLQRLHFHQLTPLSAARQRQRSLTRLHTEGLLTRAGRSVGGQRGGSAGYVYALDVAGQRLTRGSARSPRRPRAISAFTLAHRLAVAELYVRLVELTRKADQPLKLACFHAEPRCWRTFLGPWGETAILRPDALVRLRAPAYTDHYFIEIDRDTESPALLRRKLDVYRRYRASGAEQARHGVFPLVLFLTPDQPRAALIQAVIDGQPADIQRMYRAAAFDQTAEVFQAGAAP